MCLGSLAPAAAAQETPDAGAVVRSARDGVYSAGQARRGQRLYRELCASCHGENARGGDVAPGLVGFSFVFRWRDSTVGAYFEAIRTTMPQAQPGDLTDQTYTDIVSYLLQANDFPAGEGELPPDAMELRRILIGGDAGSGPGGGVPPE